MTDVIVIGGGASGMVCAGRAAELGAEVLLIERNALLGRKLRITGKGRCNIANNCPPETVVANCVSNGSFLNSAIRRFPPSEIMAFFERLGVPLKTERGNRVFPASDRASDVADALAGYCRANGVRIMTDTRAADARPGGVTVGGRMIPSRAVVVAAGGRSYPATGSSGDGYRFAKSVGHTVSRLSPSLVPLLSDDAWIADAEGLSLRNVRVSLRSGGREAYSGFGEMLFTAKGVSGPIILTASAHMPDGAAELFIDLKPALTPEALDARALRDFGLYKNKTAANALTDLLPARLIPAVLGQAGIASERRINGVTRAERSALVAALKGLRVSVSGKAGFDEAIITRGGVSANEVNPRAMESKIAPGMYFVGETLDLDAVTGGFNLMIAFATGWAAGEAIGRGIVGGV
ncbi:MAG: NAD(P)/FAD-dependent oxidoreductase [Clostridiales bacterium]|jgi:predicted Rossmann fold flavoprotein|nr:NAD(P)/FAD-dependent oxidoreductase [Clostridiales bacterium]